MNTFTHSDIFEFNSQLENISLIEDFVESLSSSLRLSDEMETNIMVSLCEAVLNAIKHGNRMNPGLKVRVGYEVKENLLLITVSDEGCGFNPREMRDPTVRASIENPSGRGLFLIRHLSDEVEFIDGGRRVIMKFILFR